MALVIEIHHAGPRVSFNSGGGAAAFFRDIDRTVGDTADIPKMIQVASRHAVHAVARPPTP